MPLIHIPNPGIQETMIHPSNVAIVDQVLDFLRLKDVQDIRYVTHAGVVRNPGTGLTEQRGDYASFGGTNRVVVEVEEDTDPDNFVISRPDVVDTEPLFFDRELQVGVFPFMVGHVTTIKILFSTHSRDTARQTRDLMKSRIGALEDGIQHKLDFSVGVNLSLLCLLQDIWVKRETRAGYGETFQQYIANHSSSSITTVSDASGFHTSLVFKRRMNRVNGYFMIQTLPEKERYEGDKAIWEFAIEYKVNYDVPETMQVSYPIMVHQQALNPIFLNMGGRAKDIRDGQANKSLSQHAAGLVEFGKASGNNLVQDMYYNIPAADTFEPKITPRNTATIFIALLSITDDKNEPLLNLGDLGTIFIDSDFLKFFKEGEHEFLNQLYRSFFLVQLYEGNYPCDPEVLNVDEKLNVYCSKELDPRKMYRVRFSVVAELSLLPQAALDRIWKYPNAVKKLVLAINWAIRNNTSYFTMWRNRDLQPWMLGPVWAMLTGKKPPSEIFHNEDKLNEWRPIQPSVTLQDGQEYQQAGEKMSDDFYIPQKVLNTTHPNTTHQRTVQIQDLIVYRKD